MCNGNVSLLLHLLTRSFTRRTSCDAISFATFLKLSARNIKYIIYTISNSISIIEYTLQIEFGILRLGVELTKAMNYPPTSRAKGRRGKPMANPTMATASQKACRRLTQDGGAQCFLRTYLRLCTLRTCRGAISSRERQYLMKESEDHRPVALTMSGGVPAISSSVVPPMRKQ